MPVTFLAQVPDGVGHAYDHTAVVNGHNGGAPSLGPPGTPAEMEEAAVAPGQRPDWNQQQFWAVLADIHHEHYGSLVRLAALFLGGAGEDAVQDAFVGVARRWDGIREADKVLIYLRRAVVNRARSELRHRHRMDIVSLDGLNDGLLPRRLSDHQPPRLPEAPGVEDIALRRLVADAVVACVRRLPRRQRECVGLRFCLQLSENETAEVLGIKPGSVKTHTSRAMQKLGPALETYR